MNVGEIYMYAGSVAPSGFLLCDGSSVSRSTYAELFDVIGTNFGQGDGSTTFGIPDLRGRVIVGASANHSLAETGGEETHQLVSAEIPVHSHGIPSHGHASTIKATTPQLTHTITQPAFTYAAPSGNSKCIGSGGYKGTTSTDATRSANLAISNHAAAACTKSGGVTDRAAFNSATSGAGDAHNNMQPYVTLNYVIYTGVTA